MPGRDSTREESDDRPKIGTWQEPPGVVPASIPLGTVASDGEARAGHTTAWSCMTLPSFRRLGDSDRINLSAFAIATATSPSGQTSSFGRVGEIDRMTLIASLVCLSLSCSLITSLRKALIALRTSGCLPALLSEAIDAALLSTLSCSECALCSTIATGQVEATTPATRCSDGAPFPATPNVGVTRPLLRPSGDVGATDPRPLCG